MRSCMIITVFVALLAVAGCGQGKSRYVNKQYPNDSIELRKNGTFTIVEGSSKMEGKYVVQNKILALKLLNGSTILCPMSDSGITDSNGKLWVKE